MFRQSVRAALVAIVVFTCGASPASADEVQRNTRPFSRFKVLLSSRLFNATLPFDVPFILWGDAPESNEPGALPTTAVLLRIAELDDSDIECNMVGPTDYGPTLLSEARTWTQTDYADRGIPAPNDVTTTTRKQFEFMVPKLKPSARYCFLFLRDPGRRMTAAEVTATAATLLPAYRGFLQKTGAVLKADTEGVERLRQALIQSLMAAAPKEGFKPIAGTVFDAEAAPSNVFEPFRTSAVEVLDPHNNAIGYVEQSNRPLSATALQNFNRWSASAALTALAAAVPAVQKDIATIQSWTPDQLTRVLVGLLPNDPVLFVEDVWQPLPTFVESADYMPTDPCPDAGPLSARCNNLDRLRIQLGNVEAAAAANPSTVPTPAGPISLQLLIARTREDVVEQRKELLQFLQAAANQRDNALQRHLSTLQASVRVSILIFTTTMGDVATRKTWYAGMDTGFAIAPSLEEVFPYVGTLLYFRPINREAPPSSFLTRFSALVGITWTSNLVKPGETAALWGSNSMLLFGGGLRATEFIRFGAGALVLKSVDPNPFVVERPIQVTPFFNLSIDIDVAGVFGRFFGGDFTPPVIGAGTTKP